MGIPWKCSCGLYLFLLISCLPKVSKNSYHDTGADKFSSQHEGLMVNVVWEHVVSYYGEAMAYNRESLGNFLFVSLCFY